MTATVITWPRRQPTPRKPGCGPASAAASGAAAGATVGAAYARGLLELAVAKGADRQALLQACDLAQAELVDRDGRVPFGKYVDLMRAGRALSGDSALALHYGEAVDISEVSILGLIGQACATMAEAFAQVNRYAPLIVETDNAGSGERFGVMADRAGFWMVDNRRNPNAFPELTESAFAQIVCGQRRFGERPFLKAVHVTHAAPAHRAEYERIFRAPVVFGADRNGLLIDQTAATQGVDRLPRYAFGVLTQHADGLLESLERSKSVRGRVESVLMPRLHTGADSMGVVAGKLGMSRQTLFRKLKAEGVTFGQVLDQLRYRMAADYLEARKVSIHETAYLVGFSEPAAFSRAYKRWTGASPAQRANGGAAAGARPRP